MADNTKNIEVDRRKFLQSAGKYGALLPPMMTFLLSTTMTSPAIGMSGNCGWGNGVDPDPTTNPNCPDS